MTRNCAFMDNREAVKNKEKVKAVPKKHRPCHKQDDFFRFEPYCVGKLPV